MEGSTSVFGGKNSIEMLVVPAEVFSLRASTMERCSRECCRWSTKVTLPPGATGGSAGEIGGKVGEAETLQAVELASS